MWANRVFLYKQLSSAALAAFVTGTATACLAAEENRLNGSVSKDARDDSKQSAPQSPYNAAVALYDKGSYGEALVAFEKLTTSKQHGELSRYYKALCLQQQRQYNAAREQYMYLYYKAGDKNIRYKAWLALKSLAQVTAVSAKSQKGATKAARKDGPGADAWITPTEGYGRSGPAASSEVSVTIIPTSCGRRGR